MVTCRNVNCKLNDDGVYCKLKSNIEITEEGTCLMQSLKSAAPSGSPMNKGQQVPDGER